MHGPTAPSRAMRYTPYQPGVYTVHTRGPALQCWARHGPVRHGTVRQRTATTPEGKPMDFRITLTGTSALIMNNARMANPLDPAARAHKEATGKRTKTDQDHETIFRLAHAGSMYYDSDAGPYLPAANIWKSLQEGAKKHRLGQKVTEGVIILTDVNPIAYKGPRDISGLWANPNFQFMAMRVTGSGSQRKRVPFCRPVFREWRTDATGTLDESIIDLAELKLIADTAGARVGLCDWRPRYGRFTAVVEGI